VRGGGVRDRVMRAVTRVRVPEGDKEGGRLERDRVRVTDPVRLIERVRVTDTVADLDASPPI
jgi:hypothetical protein